jgi:hypothetical protein
MKRKGSRMPCKPLSSGSVILSARHLEPGANIRFACTAMTTQIHPNSRLRCSSPRRRLGRGTSEIGSDLQSWEQWRQASRSQPRSLRL